MEERYHEGPVTDDVLRTWAYDENLFLSEQDEDALIWGFDVDLLFELADDPKCPKASMIRETLCRQLEAAVHFKGVEAYKDVRRVVAHAEQSPNPHTRQLGERLAKLMT